MVATPYRPLKILDLKKQEFTFTVFIVSLYAIFFFCSCSGASCQKYPLSNHYDGVKFHNQEKSTGRGFADFIKWQFDRHKGAWAEWLDEPPGPPPAKIVTGDSIIATFINHSTVLIQTEGMNILTDPVWSDRIGPFSLLSLRRHRNPGIRFEDLPKIDFVIISHNHYDHMDLLTLKRLRDKFNPLFIVPLGNKKLLDDENLKNNTELDWWQSKKISDRAVISLVPARHFSMRGIFDGSKTLWGGYVIQTPGGVIYFAGDTGFGIQFQQIREKFGPMRLSLLPIGSYQPRWFMKPMHMSPDDAIKAHKILQSETSIAIHWGTFEQGDDGMFEPLKDAAEALKKENVSSSDFILPKHGKAIIIK